MQQPKAPIHSNAAYVHWLVKPNMQPEIIINIPAVNNKRTVFSNILFPPVSLFFRSYYHLIMF